MTVPSDADFGFASDIDLPIPYMKRTRDYYVGLGYGAPYRWAHYADVPFTPLRKPLSQSRVALVTTASPFQPDKGDQGPGAAYNSSAKFYKVYAGDTSQEHDVRISHVGYDRAHTKAEDPHAWFALHALRRAVKEGLIGELAPQFFGAPTNRSHATTINVDAPEILERLRADKVDAVVLTPICPVCHQTVSLVSRHLEANGIATVIMGCAKDIVEHVGVARFMFSDFPLGNPAGKPFDTKSQDDTLRLALKVLESAPGPRTTVQSPQRWAADPAWKLDYSNIDLLSAEEIARRRAEFDEVKRIAKGIRDEVASAA